MSKMLDSGGVLEPLELLEKLAALTPRPRINLVLRIRGEIRLHTGRVR